jgi:hypothetical protein
MRTLSSAIEQLICEDFTAHFGVVGERLRAFDSGKTFRADEVTIRGYQRFEGASDPDDMAIVYAIESLDGTRGCLVDAFGVYSNPTVSVFLQHCADSTGEKPWKTTRAVAMDAVCRGDDHG